MRHATISAWQRHEEGGYTAEIEGWALHVRWNPEGGPRFDGQRGFTWTAERGGVEISGDDIFEEMEVAMADAEARTAPAHEAPRGEPAAHAPGHR
jgi:hypothetical protein